MRIIPFIMLFVNIIFFVKFTLAQNEDDSKGHWIYDENERAYNWVPTLLKSKKSSLSNFSQFNGYVFNWIPRGQLHNNSTIIDGLNWDSNLSGWNAPFSYAGMFKIFNYKQIDENFEYSNEGYNTNNRTNYLTTNSELIKKGILVNNGISNASNINQAYLQYGSGRFPNNLSVSSFFIFQNTPKGFLPNGFKEVIGVALSVDKEFRNNNFFGFSIWRNNAIQGVQSPSVIEAYALSHLRNYNPNWGWLEGQAFYSNYKKNSVPVISMRYEKKWSENTILKLSLGYAFGIQSSSQLEWTSSADPRPDYYKYLPSFCKDSTLNRQLTKWFESNPQLLQINFDRIVKINQTSSDKRSFYIINENNADISLIRASAIYSFRLKNNWSTNAGFNFSSDQIHYYNIIENLLGGQFYYNYNGWIMDDRVVNSFQNNLQNPDQKIKENEKWGPDFRLKTFLSMGWFQLKNTSPRWEFSSGINYGNDIFQRFGYNQNGLFANSSLGASSKFSFPFFGFKTQLLYKYSGRIYFRSIFFNQQEAPNSSTVFLDPSLNTFLSPFILPKIKQGIDLSIYFRGVESKVMLSAYFEKVENEYEKKFFYHDKFNSFVYGVVGQKESIYQGFESSLETLLFNSLNLEMSFNYGQYYISNNPFYEILLANDLYKVESGLLRLKYLPASSSPELTGAISIKFQPTNSINISLIGVYAAKRAMNYDLFRRSAFVLDSINNKNLYTSIHDVNYLPNQFLVNTIFSKFFSIKYGKQKLSTQCSFSIKNILSTLIPILVFEQTRFDYNKLNPDKYPPKYLYNQGATYTFGLQIQL